MNDQSFFAQYESNKKELEKYLERWEEIAMEIEA
jgi:hypothetical protein